MNSLYFFFASECFILSVVYQFMYEYHKQEGLYRVLCDLSFLSLVHNPLLQPTDYTVPNSTVTLILHNRELTRKDKPKYNTGLCT
jgi:hypothetical protein